MEKYNDYKKNYSYNEDVQRQQGEVLRLQEEVQWQQRHLLRQRVKEQREAQWLQDVYRVQEGATLTTRGSTTTRRSTQTTRRFPQTLMVSLNLQNSVNRLTLEILKTNSSLKC